MNEEQLQLFEEQTIRTAWDEENKSIAQRGGSVAAVARAALEEQTGILLLLPKMQYN